jgi:hypothetical protein
MDVILEVELIKKNFSVVIGYTMKLLGGVISYYVIELS